MANPVLQLIITAKDQASGILSNLKSQLAVLGTAIAGAFSFREAATFEKALDSVRARADETGPALDALISRVKEVAQTLGPEFGFSATEAVGGVKELIAAGFNAKEALSALKGTMALAAIEEIKVADAAILISDAIAQFGLTAGDASKVADILAASAGAVAATAVDMAEALKYTGNVASQAGLSLTETSAILDVLAKAGQRGSEAGTGLSSVLNILANPAHAATQALFALGATGTELGETLDLLERQGLNAAETIALFGEQGGRVINTLLAKGGTRAIADFGDQITHAGKSAADTAKIMQANLLGAFDRFWESLKRVGTELATPKLEPYANALDTLTKALNTFASNKKIQAFQSAVAEGFGHLYTAARDFANQIDWGGVSTAIGNAFAVIKGAADSALTSLQSIVASLTGTLPGAASLAQTASDGLKVAWEALGSAAQTVASGLDRIAQSLAGPVTVGSDLAKQALASLSGETDLARQAYDTLNSALKAGAVSQEQVTTAWERLQSVMASAQTDIDAAQVAYNAVVAAQKAGTATQEQVNAAWTRLQTVIGSAQGKIDSARLAFDGLNLQFTTGKGLTEAVALAHDRLNSTIESARQSVEKITSAVDGQTQGFQALWAALQSEAPGFLKATFDSLATAAGDLLAGINALAQKGAQFIAGFIKNADLSPVRDLFNAVADSARKLAGVIIESFPKAESAGAHLADGFTVAWSGVVGILSAVVSGTLKVVEAIGRATLEVGKYFDRYSAEEIGKIEANLNGLADSAGEFAAVAARSFDASGAAIDRMRQRSEESAKSQAALQIAGEGLAKAQDSFAAAAERQAQAQEGLASKTAELAFALQKQKAEVEALEKADLSSEAAKNKQAAATQKLWDLQDAFGESVKGLTSEQFANVSANEQVQQSLAQLGTVVEAGGIVLDESATKAREAAQSHVDLKENLEKTRAKMEQVNKAHETGNLKATETKSITEQLNEARYDAAGALNAYNAALDRNIATAETSAKTAERKRHAYEAVAQSGQALIDASLKLAEVEGNEAKVAQLVAEKKAQQAESSKKIAAEYWKEADAAQNIAEALRLKAEALEKNNPLKTEAIQKAKEATLAAESEAIAKRAVAIESAAMTAVLEKEAQQAAQQAAAMTAVLEKEAQQAAIMAGPVGQLIRLYQDQSREHQRAADASERYYDTQLQEIEGSLRVAQAKGDEAEAAKLQAEQQQLLIDQAQQIAIHRAQEASDAQQAVEAKQLELAADGALSEADQQQLADLQAIADQKKDAAEQAQNHAGALRDEAEAAQQTSSVFDEWKENLKIFGDTADDAAERLRRLDEKAEQSAKERSEELKAQGSWTASIINGWIGRLGALSDAAEQAFRVQNLNADATRKSIESATDATSLLNIALHNLGTGGAVDWANRLAIDALSIEMAFNSQATATDRLIASLEKMSEQGTVTAGSLANAANQVRTVQKSFTLLDQTRLDHLQEALDSANDKLREMQDKTQSAKDRLAELNADLLEAQGQDQKAELLRQQLDYQQQLAELEKQRTDAELTGNRELLALLAQQESRLAQLHRLKIANIEADAGEDRATTRLNALATAAERAGSALRAVGGVDLTAVSTQAERLTKSFSDLNGVL
jgi:TP901 family phage tail tape measure protein